MVAPALALLLAAAPLSFDEALRLAGQAPAVEAAAAAVEERRKLTDATSTLVANPQLGVQPGVRRHPLGVGPEVYLSLTQPLNLAGFGGARKDALAKELEQDRALGRAALHLGRLRAARAWFSLWANQAALAEAKREQDLAADWAGRVERAAVAGGLTRADAAAARSWRAEASLAVLASEGEVFLAGVLLSEALGLDATAPSQVVEALPELPLPAGAALQESVARAELAPGVELATHTRDAEEARVTELKAANGTWLQVGAQAGREGSGDLVGLATLQLTVPAFDRGERDQARSKALATRAEGERRDALARARAERLRAIHELEHTREVLDVVERDLVPAAEDAARFAQKRMEGGEGTAFEWVMARRTVLAARSRRVFVQADHALSRFAAAELAAVTGGSR